MGQRLGEVYGRGEAGTAQAESYVDAAAAVAADLKGRRSLA
jgi:hypothetical protein